MLANLNITKGLFFSQRVLLELTNEGFTREQAYSLVQKNAMRSWKNNGSFFHSVLRMIRQLNKK